MWLGRSRQLGHQAKNRRQLAVDVTHWLAQARLELGPKTSSTEESTRNGLSDDDMDLTKDERPVDDCDDDDVGTVVSRKRVDQPKS